MNNEEKNFVLTEGKLPYIELTHKEYGTVYLFSDEEYIYRVIDEETLEEWDSEIIWLYSDEVISAYLNPRVIEHLTR